MSKYQMSALADIDLVEILISGIERFGRDQSVAYVNELHERCSELAENPRLGRRTEKIPEIFRSEYKSHVIFYEEIDDSDILIIRILHYRQNVWKHLI